MPKTSLLVWIALFLWVAAAPVGKKKTYTIEVRQAEKFKSVKDRPDVQRLVGHVILSHRGRLLLCDSADLFSKDNRMIATGNPVRLESGDTLFLECKHLDYDGHTEEAIAKDSVVLTQKSTRLFAQRIFLRMKENIAHYNERGTVIDTTNTLHSQNGIFYFDKEYIDFTKDVILINKQFMATGDTMRYQTDKGLSTFLGKTTIEDSGYIIKTTEGWFSSKSNHAGFNTTTTYYAQGLLFRCDSLYLFRDSQIAEMYYDLFMYDSTNNIYITGQKGISYERDSSAKIFDSATLVSMDKEDSLFLHADTLFYRTVRDSAKSKKLLAVSNVKFHRRDFQGVCDTLTFTTIDSVFRMKEEPILWADSTQMTADSIALFIENGKPHKVFLYQNAMLLSRKDSVQFDQITGKFIIGDFEKSHLKTITVEKNSQSWTFLADKKQDIGLNKLACGMLIFHLKNRQIEWIEAINNPSGVVVPSQSLNEENMYLPKFNWDETHLPKKRSDIYIPRKAKTIPLLNDTLQSIQQK